MTKENSIALLSTCKRNPTIVRATQYTTSQQLAKANYLFGIHTAVLSAVLGTAILATIPESVDPNLKIAAGLVSLLTAALASIHTLLRLEERAEKHRKTGARCAALIREIDETLAYSEKGRNIPRDAVKSIRERYDEVSLDAPPTSQRALNKALKIIESTDAKSKKRPNPRTSGNILMPTDLKELEDRLWNAADQLRANSHLKSPEYSVPVL